MKKIFFLPFLITSSLCFSFPPDAESKILYLAHKGEITQAFSCYLELAKIHEHNYPLLQMAALSLLEEGMKSTDSQINLLSLLGAGVALHKATLPLLRETIRSEVPELQLASLNFLARFEEDEALLLIQEALSSPILLVRLEAALILAEKQNPIVIDHLSSFYGKVPPLARSLFPQILAEIESDASTKFLKQLLSEPDVNIRIATLIQAGLAQRDDLLENIRMMLTHPGYMEAEASAFALGKLKDIEAKPELLNLTKRKNPEVKLAALHALYEMGEDQVIEDILKMAEEKNLYAIALLGECRDYPKAMVLLQKLAQENDPEVQLNSYLSLLNLKDPKALDFFQHLFLSDTKDYGFHAYKTPGKALTYWKSIPSYSQRLNKEMHLEEETLRFKIKVLTKAIELPEEDFLRFADAFFKKEQKSPLIPQLIELISNKQSTKSLEFLKTKHELAGAPWVRNFATLALYKLTHEEIYEEKLLSFIKQERSKEFILQVPKNSESLEASPHLLSAKETSAFLINAFETLASSPRTQVLEALIEAIAYGNPKNRYALAGLLIRMTE